MAAASQFSFLKNPSDEERRAVGSGGRNNCSLNEGGQNMRRIATKRGGTTVLPPTTVMPTCERAAAKAFSALVIPFSRGELATAAMRTKDAAKKWKDGTALPNGYTMLMLGREIPAVRNWMLGMLGLTDERDEVPEDAQEVLWEGIDFVAAIPGPRGAKARAMQAKRRKRP